MSETSIMGAMRRPFRDYEARHFGWRAEEDGRVAVVTLNRPERKNPLTFDSYAELRDLFRALAHASDVRTIVIVGAGGNFSSGGGVILIIEPLTRLATPAAKTAFLFTRVGLAGADMGACGILPRLIGQGRASELLYTGRVMTADEGAAWGFYNRLVAPDALLAEATGLARAIADGPAFAHAMTKTMLTQEWAMGLDEMIEAEAQAQAICMATRDFRRAFEAFAEKRKPVFEGD